MRLQTQGLACIGTYADGSGPVNDPHDTRLGVASDSNAEPCPRTFLDVETLGLLQNLWFGANFLFFDLGARNTDKEKRFGVSGKLLYLN